MVEGIDYGKVRLTRAEKKKAQIRAEVRSARRSATPYAKARRKTGRTVISVRRKAGKLRAGAKKTHKKAKTVRKHWKVFKGEMSKLDLGISDVFNVEQRQRPKGKRKKRKRRKSYGHSFLDFEPW